MSIETALRRPFRGLTVLLAGLISFTLCHAHNTPPPKPPAPKPPAPPPRAHVWWIHPPRWSWLHWWEANRDPYLEVIRQGRGGQKPDQKVIAGFRDQAVAALLEATASPRWLVRASAALALGRMGEKTALRTLTNMAEKDQSERARAYALISLGLLDSAEAEEVLTRGGRRSGQEREAVLVAIALLSRIDPDTLVGLQDRLAGGPVGEAIMAALAMKNSTDPGNADLFGRILDRTESPWLASEGILALGGLSRSQAKAGRALEKILLASDRTKWPPVWKDLERSHGKLLGLVRLIEAKASQYGAAHRRYADRYERWRRENNPNAPAAAPKARHLRPRVVTLGFERILQSRLRASAAVALGRIRDPYSSEVLWRALKQPDDKFSDLYKGFVIMSLGQLGEPAALPVLGNVLRQAKPKLTRRRSSSERDSPLRGYAALALGLYARSVKTPQGPELRPGSAKVCRELAQRLADRRETLEVRSAAALALGLTGRTENLKLLQPAGERVRWSNDVLVGYVLLARGMLGDKTIIVPARKFLSVDNDRTDMFGIIARRAAVLGLGVLGSQEAIPVLREAWGLSYYVNREAALAFSLCQAYNVTVPLVELLKDSKSPLEQAFAVRCLGELFTSVRPQRLSRLISGSNYTMKNVPLNRYQSLANDFLFDYLIPAFGEQWR